MKFPLILSLILGCFGLFSLGRAWLGFRDGDMTGIQWPWDVELYTARRWDQPGSFWLAIGLHVLGGLFLVFISLLLAFS